MFKKKFYGLLVISLLVLFLGLFSTSYAMSKSDAFEICRDLCGASYLFDTPSVNPGNSSWKSYNDYLDYLDTRTERVMIVYKSNNSDFSSTSSSPYIDFYDNIDTSSGYQCITTTARRGDIKSVNQSQQSLNFYKVGQGNSKSVGTSTFSIPTGDYKFYMIYYDGNIISASFNIPPSQVYTPYYDYIVTYNNNNNVNAILRNYSINQWKIGETENFSQLDAFMFLLNDLTLGYRVGNVYGSRNLNNITGNGALYFSPNNLYVNSRYIQYNHLYELIVSKTYDNNETLEYYYYVFLPRNAVVSNGIIVDFGSGDFNIQDATNAVIDDMSNTSNLSGDLAAITSGEIYQKLGYKEYNTNWATFIWNMLLSLKNKLLLDNGPVTFTFPYMKTYITVSSDDFIVPNGLIKGFVSTFLTFGLIVLIYQRITALYHRLEEGNVSEVLTWSDVDDETFLM